MRNILPIVLLLLVVLALPTTLQAQWTTLKDGILTYQAGHYLAGQLLKPGFDAFGYNYQAHLFNSSYANAYLGRDGLPPYEGDDVAYLSFLSPADQTKATTRWYWPYRTVTLNMKWNDDWLSNKDCDGDGKLDRPSDSGTYVGSGAWETNHMSDTYADGVHWTYFVKIVSVPASASCSPLPCYDYTSAWYTASGTEIGPSIWGSFAVIQQVSNDRFLQEHGLLYRSPVNAGLGFFGNQP